MKAMTSGEILVRARNAFKMGEFPLVEKLALRILEEQPDSAVAYNLLGSVCEKTGRFRKAIEMFQKAVAAKPDYTEAHNNLGVLFKRIESYGEAIPHFERAINLSPQRGDVYYNLGNVYKALGNDEQAEENFAKAIAVDPSYVPSYINLGTMMEAKGKFGDAIRIYQKGLQVDLSQPRLHYNLGVVYERMGKLKEAKEEYEAAVKAGPGWADALNNLGVAQHRLGDSHAAEKTLREALRAEPRNARALNNLGVVAAAMGRREDAAQAYREAIKADPRYSQAVGNLAAMLEEEGKLTEALEELKRLLALEPKNLEARLRLAGILRQLENYPGAVQQYSAVLAAQPSMPEALKGLAAAYGGAGDKRKALECYQKLEALGGEQDFRVDRALLLRDAGQTAKAQEELERYLADQPGDRRARILQADIHARQGHVRQAAQTLIEVLEAFPEDTEASGRLAKFYRDLGEPQKAIETLEGLINRLEQSTDPKDVEALSQAVEEYEKAIAEHEKDFRDDREKAIRRLRELSVETAPAQKAKADDDLLMEDLEPLEEEAVPIINVGGLEPVFAVREVDEELKLEEVEEPVQEEEVAIEDERPPNLVNLLKDQELYEENPALEMFKPPAPLPSQQPQQSQQPQPAPLPPPPAPPSAPAQPAPLALSPQGESVLANSLKESVAAQSKVVDKLFDEMRDLSRKIDEKRAPPQQMPPIMLTMPPGPPPTRPMVPDYPTHGPQPQGFPRYASDVEELDEATTEAPPEAATEAPAQAAPEGAAGETAEELAVAPPAAVRKRPRVSAAPSEGGTEPGPGRAAAPETGPGAGPGIEEVGEVSLEEVPEELPPEAPPRGAAPLGLDGVGPITETEPEPEIDTGEQEQPEAELETLEGPEAAMAEAAPAPGTERAAAGPTPESASRSSDEVRRELRSYLDGVRGRLDKGGTKASPGDLLDYLGKLSDYLPDREKRKFRGSNERLAMESLKARLAGHKGLREKVAEQFRPKKTPRRPPRMTRSRVVDTFSYLRDLAAWHPDKAVAEAMRERIESIVSRMGRLR